MPIKVFLAGAENDSSVSLLNKLGARYRLASFYYLRKKSKARIEEILFNTNPTDVVYLIDSGAFTFMDSQAAEIEDDPKMFWSGIERYVEEYAEFLSTYNHRLFAAVEMDLDELLQRDNIVEAAGRWRKPLEEWHEKDYDGELGYIPPPIIEWRHKLEKTGVPIVNVWHPERGKDGWTHQVTVSPYCGISSSAWADLKWFPMLNEARKKKSVVHAFGVTRVDLYRQAPLYSCDSTSWMVRGRYGETVIFRNGKLAHFDNTHKDIRRRYKHVYEKEGISWKDVEREKPQTINEINLLAWLQFAEYLWNRPSKDYWENEVGGSLSSAMKSPRAAGRESANERAKETESTMLSERANAKAFSQAQPIDAGSKGSELSDQSSSVSEEERAKPSESTRKRERSKFCEGAITVGRATAGESTEPQERSRTPESAIAAERVKTPERTKRSERATYSESTKAQEQSTNFESTTDSETPKSDESTKPREGAARPKSTAPQERPIAEEETVDSESTNISEKNPLRELEPHVTLESFSVGKMACDNCFLSDRCRYFEGGSECHFQMENRFADQGDFIKAMEKLLAVQYQRVLLASAMERMDGGQIDKNISAEMDRLQGMMENVMDSKTPVDSLDKPAAADDGPGLLATILARALNPSKRKRRIAAPTEPE